MVLVSFITLVSVCVTNAQEALPSPQATLELEWEVVDDAVAYEVKLVPKAGGEPIVVKTNEPKISHRVPAGTYSVQIRSQDKANGYMGAWGEVSEIEVTSKIVALNAPADGAVLKEPKEKRKEVEFRWQPVVDAKTYSLRLWSSDAPDAIEFKTKETSKRLKLLSGKTYFWQVVFETVRSIRYQAAPVTWSFTLLGSQLLPPEVERTIEQDAALPLTWKPSAGAETYQAVLSTRYLDETEWRPLDRLEITKERVWKTRKLQPAAYKIEVVASAKHNVSSEPGVLEFVVKPTEAELDAALKPVLAAELPKQKNAK